MSAGRVRSLRSRAPSYMYPIKITQKFWQLGIPITVIFACAPREPARNKGVALFHKSLKARDIFESFGDILSYLRFTIRFS
jgi:hypothetical protein